MKLCFNLCKLWLQFIFFCLSHIYYHKYFSVVMKINRIKRYFLSALTLSSGSIVLNGLAVLFNIYISGKIGAEAMGLYTLTGGVYSFAITVATSGVNLAVVRLVSSALPYGESNQKSEGDAVFKIMRQALFYVLTFSLISSVLLFSASRFVGTHLLGDLRVVPALRVMAFSLVPIGISSMLNGYFCAVRRVYKNVIVQFFEQGVKISVVFCTLSFFVPAGVEYACLCIALSGMIAELGSLCLNVILFLIDKKRNFKGSNRDAQRVESFAVFRSAFPLAVSAYLRSLLSTLEHIAIPWGLKKSGLGAQAALASYGTLHGMVFPFIFFPSSVLGAFSSLLVPEIASAKEAKDFSSIRRIVGYVFSFSLLFSLCVSGVFICFSSQIGIHFFGSEEAGHFIKLLSPLIPLMYLDFAVDAILKGLGEHLYTMRVNIFDSLISVVLIFTLVPFFGIYGYVAIIFITEIFNVSMSIIRLLNKTEVKTDILGWIIKPTLSIIMATMLCRLLFSLPPFDSLFTLIGLGKISTGIEIFVCVLLYILFSKITGAISKDEINLAKAAVKKSA